MAAWNEMAWDGFRMPERAATMEDEGMWSLIMDPTPCHWNQWSLNAVSFFDRTARQRR